MTASLEPDVILMDLGMPILDGIEATRSIRDRSPVPIFVLTASEAPEDVARARGAGASAFLRKDMRAEDLVARLHALRRR